jgi:hypothetical protein
MKTLPGTGSWDTEHVGELLGNILRCKIKNKKIYRMEIYRMLHAKKMKFSPGKK